MARVAELETGLMVPLRTTGWLLLVAQGLALGGSSSINGSVSAPRPAQTSALQRSAVPHAGASVAGRDEPPVDGWRGWIDRQAFVFNGGRFLVVPIDTERSAWDAARGVTIGLSSVDGQSHP